MSKSLNDRIDELEKQLKELQHKLDYVSDRAEEKSPQPTSQIGQIQFKHGVMPSSGTGLGRVWTYPGHIVWNDADGLTPPYGTTMMIPAKGYNKHSHSRYSGGAFIKDVLEVVDYDFGGSASSNKKHSQSYWLTDPPIKKVVNTNGESVEKIGVLDLIFNADNRKWGSPAYEIDVRKCAFVMRDSNGDIMTDANGKEMASPLYNSNPLKTNIIWDPDGKQWRFYAVYAPDSSQI